MYVIGVGRFSSSGGAGGITGATPPVGATYTLHVSIANHPFASVDDRGFRIQGAAAGDNSGVSVSSAGDVNADGFDDVIVGANLATANNQGTAGESYVILGRASGFGNVDLAGLRLQ